jgi:hypothetical protein
MNGSAAGSVNRKKADVSRFNFVFKNISQQQWERRFDRSGWRSV